MGIEDIWASVQNILACKYIVMGANISHPLYNITPICIKVVIASVQNVHACKYIASMGIEIVLMVVKSGDKSLRIYRKLSICMVLISTYFG